MLATVDIKSVTSWNIGNNSPWMKATSKAHWLWNYQSRSSLWANKVKQAIGKKLVTPAQTRWNSYFDSIVSLLTVLENQTHMNAINALIIKENKTPFNDMDINVSD